MVSALKLEQKDTTQSFNDVEADSWYASFVNIAVSQGIVNGVGENEFAPNAEISRQDLCTIIYKALLASHIHLPETQRADFSDQQAIKDYAMEAVNMLKTLGIISGRDGGNFAPEATTTRAEAAKIIKGILDYMSK